MRQIAVPHVPVPPGGAARRLGYGCASNSIQEFAVIRLFSLALLGAGGVYFHTHLAASCPKADEVVRAAPAEISLTFTTRPEVPLTKVTLLRADSTPVRLEPVKAGKDTMTVVAKVPGSLPTGGYIVSWRTASRDGHVVRGSYRFSYSTAPAGAASAVASPARSQTSRR
jgi:methionine-rich copper-binding protein CopC